MSVTVLSRPLDVHSGDRKRVLTKIQNLVVDWIDQLVGGDLPCFEAQTESDDDDNLCRGMDVDGLAEGGVDKPRAVPKRLVLPAVDAGVGEIARSMNACVSYASILCVLSFSMRLLETGKTATQREIYYAFVKHFANQTKCNDAILDCCALLGEPRHCLGIVASSRGYLAGRISIRGEGFEDWQDPRSTGGTSGLAITSDWLTRPLEIKSDARYVVVVEKDGVFNRLVEDGFYERAERSAPVQARILAARKGVREVQGSRHGLGGVAPFPARRPQPPRAGAPEAVPARPCQGAVRFEVLPFAGGSRRLRGGSRLLARHQKPRVEGGA